MYVWYIFFFGFFSRVAAPFCGSTCCVLFKLCIIVILACTSCPLMGFVLSWAILLFIISEVLFYYTHTFWKGSFCGLVALTAWSADRLHPHLEVQGESGRYLPCWRPVVVGRNMEAFWMFTMNCSHLMKAFLDWFLDCSSWPKSTFLHTLTPPGVTTGHL